ncbi:MAG: hypothetical protein WBP94_09510 [Rhodomicrobiaceae bacterium]
MLRGFKTAAVVLCVVGSAGLSGCAETSYPRLPDLTGIGHDLLTPQQQQQAIKDLSTEQQARGTDAAKAIEGHQ